MFSEPAAQIVRKQWQGKVGLWHRMLAARGAVVISIGNKSLVLPIVVEYIDNRGTPCLKGREWRKSIYKQIGMDSNIYIYYYLKAF